MHGIEPSCRIFQQASEKERAFKQGTSNRDPLLPDLFGDFADQAQFLPLIVLRQDIALFRRRESALRAEAKPVERHELRRLFDTLFDFCLAAKRPEAVPMPSKSRRKQPAASGSVFFLQEADEQPEELTDPRRKAEENHETGAEAEGIFPRRRMIGPVRRQII